MDWFWISNARVELWNDVNLWYYFDGILRITRTFESPKSTSIEKFCMGVNAEFDIQRHCLVMCLNQMAGFSMSSSSVSNTWRRSISLMHFLKREHWISRILDIFDRLYTTIQITYLWGNRANLAASATIFVNNCHQSLCVISPGILIKIAMHMNILHVRVHYLYRYIDFGVA